MPLDHGCRLDNRQGRQLRRPTPSSWTMVFEDYLLTRLRLRPTRRVFVWMDSRVARRSEAELTGACCLACIPWRRPVDVPAPSAGWFARTVGKRAALAAKNQWITADQSG